MLSNNSCFSFWYPIFEYPFWYPFPSNDVITYEKYVDDKEILIIKNIQRLFRYRQLKKMIAAVIIQFRFRLQRYRVIKHEFLKIEEQFLLKKHSLKTEKQIIKKCLEKYILCNQFHIS